MPPLASSTAKRKLIPSSKKIKIQQSPQNPSPPSPVHSPQLNSSINKSLSPSQKSSLSPQKQVARRHRSQYVYHSDEIALEALRLKEQEGLIIKEISQRLGIPPGSIFKLWKRAREVRSEGNTCSHSVNDPQKKGNEASNNKEINLKIDQSHHDDKALNNGNNSNKKDYDMHLTKNKHDDDIKYHEKEQMFQANDAEENHEDQENIMQTNGVVTLKILHDDETNMKINNENEIQVINQHDNVNLKKLNENNVMKIENDMIMIQNEDSKLIFQTESMEVAHTENEFSVNVDKNKTDPQNKINEELEILKSSEKIPESTFELTNPTSYTDVEGVKESSMDN